MNLLNMFESEGHSFSIKKDETGYVINGVYNLNSYYMECNKVFEVTELEGNINDLDLKYIKINLLKNMFYGIYKGVDVVEKI